MFANYLVVDAQRLVTEPNYYHRLLRSLYPQAVRADYLDGEFRERRDDFRARFADREWDGHLKNISFDERFSLRGFEPFNSDIGGAWSTSMDAELQLNTAGLKIHPAHLLLRALAPLNIERDSLDVSFEIDGEPVSEHRFALPREIRVLSLPLPAPSRLPCGSTVGDSPAAALTSKRSSSKRAAQLSACA